MTDPRHILHGHPIPREHYCDQPYVVRLDSGEWLCVLTTGAGTEGERGQHVVSTRSNDQGRTWSPPLDIEPADGPEASWAMPLHVPGVGGAGGRVYAFYIYNTENRREVLIDRRDPATGEWVVNGRTAKRVDTLGDLAFRYSDDGGRSWSPRRYTVPIRQTRIDRDNPYAGRVRFLWGVGKPIAHGGAAYLGFAKVGRFGRGFMAVSEGYFLRSDNILTEADPERVEWATLPEGDVGLRSPGGPVADEHNLVGLSDGSLYCTYRTTDGHPCHAYSRDRGATWTPPAFMTYEPGGRRVKHPRAANFVWRTAAGNYLYWFHNHGAVGDAGYGDRNPAWVAGGTEIDGPDGRMLRWSQPEVLLYDDVPAVRLSYPSLVEDGGRTFVTETQKTVARVHEIDPSLLEGLWGQFDARSVAADGLLLDHAPAGSEVDCPALPPLRLAPKNRPSENLRAGVTLDLWIEPVSRPGDWEGPAPAGPVRREPDPPKASAGRVLLDNRTAAGQGFALATDDDGAIRITLNDGRRESAWASDAGLIRPGRLHHVAVIVDGGPNLILFVVDGALCDGGEQRPFGWGRLDAELRDVNGSPRLRLDAAVRRVRLYGRALRVSEAVGNFRAGPDAESGATR